MGKYKMKKAKGKKTLIETRTTDGLTMTPV